MASILQTGGGYRATVTKKKSGVVLFRQSKTFTRKGDADMWAKELEVDIERNGVPEPVLSDENGKLSTIADLIEDYIRRQQAIKPIGRSKYAALKQLVKFDIARLQPHKLTQGIVQRHIELRRETGTGPATVNNDLIWLRTVLRYHGIAHHRSALDAVADAASVAKSERLIAKAEQRNRRPTDEELQRLTYHFDRSRNPWMTDVVWFAIYSTRRQGEIAQLQMADNNPVDRTGMVRGLKDPRGRVLNETFKYSDHAWQIVEEQHENPTGRIFPHSTDSISKHFTGACKLLGIEGLRFHDLRHEAVSRLFETGLDIPAVQLHSLHKQWSTLQRYANLQAKNAGKVIEHLHLHQIR